MVTANQSQYGINDTVFPVVVTLSLAEEKGTELPTSCSWVSFLQVANS